MAWEPLFQFQGEAPAGIKRQCFFSKPKGQHVAVRVVLTGPGPSRAHHGHTVGLAFLRVARHPPWGRQGTKGRGEPAQTGVRASTA